MCILAVFDGDVGEGEGPDLLLCVLHTGIADLELGREVIRDGLCAVAESCADPLVDLVKHHLARLELCFVASLAVLGDDSGNAWRGLTDLRRGMIVAGLQLRERILPVQL